ncbi:hypothetical protein NKR23_g8248 [Pleurostoma richardsiae]|uniref:DUF427 domain-containing protein n=1 Tax=Pleurostoma richardsiae TaxID=41990 RepID=A0AA38VFZ7_9PEZI|nr:hypothetical protein NKR23_g8248 [Pleurostoma richardsiae]
MPSGHAKASVGGTVVAETDSWEEVEGNVYFPPAAVKTEHFKGTGLHTTCPWKGEASYYTVSAGGQELANAAWYYPEPKAAAENIRGYVAFYKNKVDVTTS